LNKIYFKMMNEVKERYLTFGYKTFILIFAFALLAGVPFFASASEDGQMDYCLSPNALSDSTTVPVGSTVPTLQNILDEKYGYGTVGVLVDQKNYQIWNLDDSRTYTIELEAEFISGHAEHDNVFGYYTDGRLETFVPLMMAGSHRDYPNLTTGTRGDTVTFTVEGVQAVGFAINTHNAVEPYFVATENHLNRDGLNRALVYEISNEVYVLAFEDVVHPLSDNDYTDMVVEVRVSGCGLPEEEHELTRDERIDEMLRQLAEAKEMVIQLQIQVDRLAQLEAEQARMLAEQERQRLLAITDITHDPEPVPPAVVSPTPEDPTDPVVVDEDPNGVIDEDEDENDRLVVGRTDPTRRNLAAAFFGIPEEREGIFQAFLVFLLLLTVGYLLWAMWRRKDEVDQLQ
jgi:hypothetical protein